MDENLLDLYVLSLLDRGIETPYSLQRKGGLSLGASTPCLRRLSEARLVKRQEEESATNRPRHVYTLTSAGRELARAGWQKHLRRRQIPSNLDGILRLADMAIHYGANSGEVAGLLKRASDERRSLARQAAVTIPKATPTVSYQEMRCKCSATGLRAEAEALAKLATQVAKQGSPRAEQPILWSGRERRAPVVKE
jgi:DNA-binding PadR family transcriptional regulator